jgi:nitrite reductase (cytochrome c-552)
MVGILTGVFFFNRNNTVITETARGEIAATETNSAVWGQFYPAHWDSYQANLSNAAQPSHYDTKPYLQAMYEGTGFAKEYNEPVDTYSALRM